MLSFQLPSNKSSTFNDTLISIPKYPVHVYCSKLTNIVNDSLKNKFLNIHRNTEVNLFHKIGNKENKDSYRPVSFL